MTRIFIDGKAGTTGLKIFSRFQNRPELELIQIDEDKRKDPTERAKCINDSDITFLCLPDPAAIEAVALVTNPKVKLIDTSTAHPHPAGLGLRLSGACTRLSREDRKLQPYCGTRLLRQRV